MNINVTINSCVIRMCLCVVCVGRLGVFRVAGDLTKIGVLWVAK